MAGCSIVMLMLVMWPFLLIGSIITVAAVATVEFVTSPAFPVLLVGFLCYGLAGIDLVRIVWRKYRERDAFPIEGRLFIRPAVLTGLGVVLVATSIFMAGGMVLDWYRSIETDA